MISSMDRPGAVVNILIIEDDPQMQYLLARICSHRGYLARTADSAETALELLEPGFYQVALVDIVMTGMSGLDLIPRLKSRDPYLEVIMVTGREERETAVDAFRGGALDYIVKPFNVEDLSTAISRALDHRTLTLLNANHRSELESKVQEQTSQLKMLISTLQDSYNNTVATLGRVLTVRDHGTGAHAERVVDYAEALGREIGLRPGQEVSSSSPPGCPTLVDLRLGSLLHDLGKISLPDRILLKAGPLTAEEWKLVKRHPVIGYELLAGIPFLKGALPIVRYHHERWDGQGYPDGLRGEEIPLEARIFSVADAFDAMTSNRPYREAMRPQAAVRCLQEAAGKQLDSELVGLFLDWLKSEAETPLGF